MTVNFFGDDLDDPDDRPHGYDPHCSVCNPGLRSPFDQAADHDEFDDSDDDYEDPFEDRPEPWEPIDDLHVDFMFDQRDRQLLCVHTGGLWLSGLPELYIRPPRKFSSGDALADAHLAVFLATGLIHLGQELVSTDGFEIPPYQADLDGRPVQFWLGRQEPPFPRLAATLGLDVDTVIRVECSLWSTSSPGRAPAARRDR
jgi:hypothetical protein